MIHDLRWEFGFFNPTITLLKQKYEYRNINMHFNILFNKSTIFNY